MCIINEPTSVTIAYIYIYGLDKKEEEKNVSFNFWCWFWGRMSEDEIERLVQEAKRKKDTNKAQDEANHGCIVLKQITLLKIILIKFVIL